MSDIKTDAHREIVRDFAEQIKQRTKRNIKPSKIVIEFRNERKDNCERDIVQVPTEVLRFRKENGRIASEVLSYEHNRRSINEASEEGQLKLKGFLFNKDPEKTDELCKSIKHDKQKDPAIITCDGFLINGNRRKLALELLYKETKEPEYQWMSVVILPSEDDTDTGGPPTIKEIAQIENRYQSQRDGKAEYYGFDEALSTRRYIRDGISLEEKLRDDPQYIDMTPSEFKSAVIKFNEEYLEPLKCVDEYLDYLGREGMYTNISTGRGDREGKWQAFLDYYKYISKNLDDVNKRLKINVNEDEVGDVKTIAFKLIRMRELSGIKLHQSMRCMPKWLQLNSVKKELMEIEKVEDDIPDEVKYHKDGVELDDKEKDEIWRQRNKTDITRQVKKAILLFDKNKEEETPIAILNAALKKLQHNNLLPKNIRVADAKEAMKILNVIEVVTKELKRTFFEIEKGPVKLKEKFNKK